MTQKECKDLFLRDLTQEEKELLLKDLCARLPYGVKIKLGNYDYQVCGYSPEIKELPLKIWYYYKKNSKSYIDVYLEDYLPYLRPMSSMTEEEEIEYETIAKPCYNIFYVDNSLKGIDWLNKNHFDYRGLIEKGLAIEVTEENNPYKSYK